MTEKNSTLQFKTDFDWLGGEARIQLLTNRFYELMDLEPKFSALRAVHHSDLSNARQRLCLFLIGWLGGPQWYIEQYGHPRLRQRHINFHIGITERDQWVACMAQAMLEIQIPQALYQKLLISFYNTADWMRNQFDPIEGIAQIPQTASDSQPHIQRKLCEIMLQYNVRITESENE